MQTNWSLTESFDRRLDHGLVTWNRNCIVGLVELELKFYENVSERILACFHVGFVVKVASGCHKVGCDDHRVLLVHKVAFATRTELNKTFKLNSSL